MSEASATVFSWMTATTLGLTMMVIPLLFTTFCVAQDLGDGQLITGANGAASVALSDLDGDGDADLVYAAEIADEILWRENQINEETSTNGGFGPEQVIAGSANGASSVAVGDIDGDGDADLVYSARVADEIGWRENQINDGTTMNGGFGPAQVISGSANGASSVDLADIDRDGDLDILYTEATSDVVSWRSNQIDSGGTANGGFGTKQVISGSNGASSVVGGDIDNDGDADVIYAAEIADEIVWRENQIDEGTTANGGFGPEKMIDASVNGASSVSASDVDGDGDLDLLYAASIADKLGWRKNQINAGTTANGGFGPANVINSSANGASSITASDLDGDMDPDLVYAAYIADQIAWYENTPDVLPVELARFVALPDEEQVTLTWQTVSEQDNAGFDVQRRAGSEKAWETVYATSGAGTTDRLQSYRFVDESLPFKANRLWYRLRQIDTDGTVHLSDEIEVERPGATTLSLQPPFPNPASDQATVRVAVPTEWSEARLELYDLLGRKLSTIATRVTGRLEIPVPISGLAPGKYIVRLRGAGQVATETVTVVR